MRITLAYDIVSECRVRISILLWARIIYQLRSRGNGSHESGAFLLGRKDSDVTRVTAYICYDDLDPEAYQFGAIAFHAVGNAALWEYCRTKQLKVLADVHTHPGSGVRQSVTDQENPMLPIQGHTAIIVPNFAHTSWWSLHAVGVYEYLGNFQWRTHNTAAKSSRVQLAIW